MFTIVTTYAQVDSVTIGETERIIDKYSEKVFSSISGVVESLEAPTKMVFESVVRLQIARGVGLILFTILSIIVVLIGFHRIGVGVKLLEKTNIIIHKNNLEILEKESVDNSQPALSKDHNSLLELGYAVLGVGSGLFIISLFSLYYGILYLMAPEWFAIKELIDLV